MKVKAFSQGFYKGRHIDPGTVFDIDEKDFIDREDKTRGRFAWVEKVFEEAPSKKGFFQ